MESFKGMENVGEIGNPHIGKDFVGPDKNNIETNFKKAEEIKKAEAILNRTNDLEAKQEKEFNQVGPSDIKFRSFVKKWTKRLLMTVLISKALEFGFTSEQVVEDSKKIGQKTKYDEYTGEKQEDLKKIYIDRTGIDFYSLARESGFRSDALQVVVDNGNGPYFLHIGQKHYINGAETNSILKTNIIASQVKIKSFFSALLKTNNNFTNLFCEGITNDFYTEEINSLRLKFNSIELSSEAYLKLMQEYKNHSEACVKGFSSLRNIISYFCYNKLQILKSKFSVPKEITESLNKFEAELKNNVENLILSGSQFELAVEKGYILKPAETEDGNDGAFKNRKLIEYLKEKISTCLMDTIDLEQKLKEAPNLSAKYKASVVDFFNKHRKSDNLMTSYEDGLREEISFHNTRLNKMRNELKKLEEEDVDLIFNRREDIAINLVAKSGKSQIYPIIYGVAHDFSDNVIRYNELHPDKKIGLIEINEIHPNWFRRISTDMSGNFILK